MLQWNTLKDLHVTKKLEEILGKWFGIDIIYSNEHGRIISDIMGKDKPYRSQFFKVQMQMPYGHELISSEAEKLEDAFKGDKAQAKIFESVFPGIHFMAIDIKLEGDTFGYILGYPFFKDGITQSEIETAKLKMIECGANEIDTGKALESLHKLSEQSLDYCKELMELLAKEVSTYHDEISKREDRIKDLNSEVSHKYRYHSMIGKSESMQKIYRLLEKISNSEATILIQGSNGTGKELVAKAIHYNSSRKDAIFVAQNCSAFNDNLLDSELFGHVKGAFTGAVKDKKGLFEIANGGTLFLDEIGDTSLSMQVKLLRVLQEGTFLPVGATSPRKVNVRVLCATNKPLKEMIARGEFREDLYYRINVINVQLPSLKDRKEDLPILIDHFLEKKCAEVGKITKELSKKTLEILLDYDWPGNVRELQNEIERMVVLAGEDKVVTPDLISARITDLIEDKSSDTIRNVNFKGTLKDALEELEKYMIKEGLKRTGFNKSKLAKELGMSRAGLIMKVEKYELDKRALKKASGDD